MYTDVNIHIKSYDSVIRQRIKRYKKNCPNV